MSVKTKLRDMRYGARPWHFQLAAAVLALGALAWIQTRQPTIEELGAQIAERYADQLASQTIDGNETAGLTWTMTELTTRSGGAVTWNGDHFIAAGVDTNDTDDTARRFVLHTSADGLEWGTRIIAVDGRGTPGQTFRIDGHGQTVLISAERFDPVPNQSILKARRSILLISFDGGESWSESAIDDISSRASDNARFVQAALFDNRVYALIGDEGELRFYGTADGETWNQTRPPTDDGFVERLVAAPSGIVVSGFEDDEPFLRRFNPVNRTWSTMQIPSRVAWFEDLHNVGDAIVGEGYDSATDQWARFQLDGDEWTYLPLDEQEAGSLALATGPAGTIHVATGSREFEPGSFVADYRLTFTDPSGTTTRGYAISDAPMLSHMRFVVGDGVILALATDGSISGQAPTDLANTEPTLSDYTDSILRTEADIWQLVPTAS